MNETAGIYRPQLPFEANFTQLPNRWLRDPNLSMQAKGLLAYFMSHDYGFRLGFNQILRENRDGKHAIRSAIGELIAAGYLITERTTDARGYNAGLLYVLFDPQNPKSENPTLENPTLENQTAYIENKLNKENNLIKEITRASRISPDFQPSQENIEWAKTEHPNIDLDKATANFIDYWETKPSNATKLDWQRTWRVWIRNTKPDRIVKPKNDFDALKRWAAEEDAKEANNE